MKIVNQGGWVDKNEWKFVNINFEQPLMEYECHNPSK